MSNQRLLAIVLIVTVLSMGLSSPLASASNDPDPGTGARIAGGILCTVTASVCTVILTIAIAGALVKTNDASLAAGAMSIEQVGPGDWWDKFWGGVKECFSTINTFLKTEVTLLTFQTGASNPTKPMIDVPTDYSLPPTLTICDVPGSSCVALSALERARYQPILEPRTAEYVSIAGGYQYSLGLTSDGYLAAWGKNANGQCAVRPPFTGFTTMAAGYLHVLALKADGSIVAWGSNDFGQCNVPSPNAGFTAVAAGDYHSIGLKADGSIVAWGRNAYGEGALPSPNAGFVAITAGYYHNLGLKDDGSVVAWGWNNAGQCTVPSPNADFASVGAGDSHSMGLKSDGSVIAWGNNSQGQCDVPLPNTGFVAISAGGFHSLGLKSNGTIRAWGSNSTGQCTVDESDSTFVAIAGGGYHSLGIKTDGSVAGWGRDLEGQCTIPRDHLAAAINSVDVNGFQEAVQAGAPDAVLREKVLAMAAAMDSVLYWYNVAREKIEIVVPDSTILITPQSIAAARDSIIANGLPEFEQTMLLNAGLTPAEVDSITAFTIRELGVMELITQPLTIGQVLQETADAMRIMAQSSWTGVGDGIPAEPGIALHQNVPNPFNPHTTVSFDLMLPGRAKLEVFDVKGAHVATLVDADLPAGPQVVEWRGTNDAGLSMPSGVYFARLETTEGVRAIKVTLVK